MLLNRMVESNGANGFYTRAPEQTPVFGRRKRLISQRKARALIRECHGDIQSTV